MNINIDKVTIGYPKEEPIVDTYELNIVQPIAISKTTLARLLITEGTEFILVMKHKVKMTKTKKSPVVRRGNRLVKVVSNKLIQDYWREEFQMHPELKVIIPPSKAMNFINKHKPQARLN